MMDAQIFDTGIAHLGGRLDIKVFGQKSSFFDYHKKNALNSIKQLAALQPQQPPFKIHFDYVNNPSLNAIAFNAGTKYFIGLYGGTVPIVHSLYLHILAHPSLLQNVGDTGNEIMPSQYRRPGLVDANILVNYGSTDGMPLSDISPRDHTRKLYARTLASLAVDFLVHHELAHILYGHLGLLNARTGTKFMAELDWVHPSGLDTLDIQTLEMDADCFAVTQGVFGVLSRVKRKESLNPEWQKYFNNIEDSMRLWFLAVFLALRLFTTPILDKNRLHLQSHPPARVRQFIAYSTAIDAIRKFASSDLAKQIQSSHGMVIREAEEAYAVITGEAPEFGTIKDSISPEAIAHMDLLLTTWKELRPKLLPFARLPLVE